MKRRSLVGETLHQTYRIERLLVRGGMGSVFEASHSRLPSKRFAVKVLHANVPKQLEAYKRFRREAEITTQLGHPHIVEVIDFNETPEGEPYMVMEYLEGETLGARIRREKQLPPNDVVMVAQQVGSALEAAHRKGVVHRDVKPDNIFLVGAVDGPIQVKVLDFGISKIKKSETLVTGANLLLGTVRYMSPEQASAQADEVDERTDIFALAAICYEALTGVRAFDGPNLASVIDRICEDPPQPAPLPGPVRAVLFQALAKDKAMRTPSASIFAAELSDAVSRVEEEEEQIPTSVSPMMRSRDLSLVDEVDDPITDLELPRGAQGRQANDLFAGVDSGMLVTHQVTTETHPELPSGVERRRWPAAGSEPATEVDRPLPPMAPPPRSPKMTGPVPLPSFGEVPEGDTSPSLAPPAPMAHASVAAVAHIVDEKIAPPAVRAVDLPDDTLGRPPEVTTDSVEGLVDARRLTGRMLWMASVVGVLLTAALVISLVRAGGDDERAAGAGGKAPDAQSSRDSELAVREVVPDAAISEGSAPAEVKISLRLSPKDAEARMDGKLLRERELHLPRSANKHLLEVKAPGFRSFRRHFVADSSTVLVVALDRVDTGGPDAGVKPDAARKARPADARVRRRPRTPVRKPPAKKKLGDGLPEL